MANYITVQDIRDEGITTAMASDAKVLDYIETWQPFIDRACRQWFEPRSLTLRLDGNSSNTLHLAVPIISVEYLKINNSTEPLDTIYYRVYNSNTYPDDRRNPRIKLIKISDFRDIYTTPLVYGDLQFIKGQQNQEIKGEFGFVEPGGDPPKMIQRALTKLVIEKLSIPIFIDPSSPSPMPPLSPATGELIEEKTDDHSRKWGSRSGEVKSRSNLLTGITNDPEIIEIINLYRAPMGIAVPSDPSYIRSE